MSSHFVLLRVRLAGRRPKPTADGTIPLVGLIAQWPEGEAEPVQYWISNLPFGASATPGVEMAVNALRGDVPEERIRTVAPAFTRRMTAPGRPLAYRALEP
ncbi:hypothetical protein [Streptomyces sp. NPDC059979]|uniref:hypothetical protein n=1 Tax=Streptomyces sp. NPDC059979 TaxID=3347021 RepID=UPI00369CF5BA